MRRSMKRRPRRPGSRPGWRARRRRAFHAAQHETCRIAPGKQSNRLMLAAEDDIGMTSSARYAAGVSIASAGAVPSPDRLVKSFTSNR
ncbi:hypothetical protein FB601_10135 [Burkholderia sp. SJZ091]|nr:hypothetical protein FB601_10135 [Burkholderia sp. SJZ091]